MRYSWNPVGGDACRVGWLWKFSTGAGQVPEDPSKALTIVLYILRETLGGRDPSTSEIPDKLVPALYASFEEVKRFSVAGRHLRNVGNVIFSYWLSLTDPGRFMPFDPPVHCRLFQDSEDCLRAARDPGRMVDVGLYHAELLKAIHDLLGVYDLISRSGDRLEPHKVHDLFELHSALKAVLCASQ